MTDLKSEPSSCPSVRSERGEANLVCRSERSKATSRVISSAAERSREIFTCFSAMTSDRAGLPVGFRMHFLKLGQ